jgi:hypothetical protein
MSTKPAAKNLNPVKEKIAGRNGVTWELPEGIMSTSFADPSPSR